MNVPVAANTYAAHNILPLPAPPDCYSCSAAYTTQRRDKYLSGVARVNDGVYISRTGCAARARTSPPTGSVLPMAEQHRHSSPCDSSRLLPTTGAGYAHRFTDARHVIAIYVRASMTPLVVSSTCWRGRSRRRPPPGSLCAVRYKRLPPIHLPSLSNLWHFEPTSVDITCA